MKRSADPRSARHRILNRVQRLPAPDGEGRPDSSILRVVQLTRDYFTVAATPKFKAAQRSRLRDAARAGMVLVVVAACLNCLWLIPLHSTQAPLLIAVNVLPAVIAVFAFGAIATRARRRPEAVAFVVLAALDTALLGLRLGGTELGVVAGGYVLLMPLIVATVMPWATKYHAGWLVLHACFALVYATTVPNSFFGTRGGLDMFALFVVATTVSVFGHINRLQTRVLNYIQLEQIRAYNRQARRDQDRLDRLNRILEQASRTDDLTGLRNRLSLKLDLSTHRARIARHGEVVSVLMIDLDRFKAVNDSLGHVAGDEVLRKTAACIAAAIRQEDGAYRYGGEEFLVLLDSTDPDDAAIAAERIRRSVADLGLQHPGNPPHGRVTVSVGVASIGPDDLADDDEAWVERADAALYLAKDRGRNRCEVDEISIPRLRSLPGYSVAGSGPPDRLAPLARPASRAG
jgi:diguanylate cyclase (GGDEF)-like protein